jgi:sorbitol/mannitol transport system permease protein
MATRKSESVGRGAVAPSTLLLFVWMIVPLALTLYFSALRYNLLYPERSGFIGFTNYTYFVTNPAFATAIVNTLVLVGSVLIITVVLGTLLALLLDKPISARGSCA